MAILREAEAETEAAVGNHEISVGTGKYQLPRTVFAPTEGPVPSGVRSPPPYTPPPPQATAVTQRIVGSHSQGVVNLAAHTRACRLFLFPLYNKDTGFLVETSPVPVAAAYAAETAFPTVTSLVSNGVVGYSEDTSAFIALDQQGNVASIVVGGGRGFPLEFSPLPPIAPSISDLQHGVVGPVVVQAGVDPAPPDYRYRLTYNPQATVRDPFTGVTTVGTGQLTSPTGSGDCTHFAMTDYYISFRLEPAWIGLLVFTVSISGDPGGRNPLELP